MTRRLRSTWMKIFELGSSDDELDRAYAYLLASVIDYRINQGITQSELARRSGLTTSMISKIEAQHSVPSLISFLKYLRGLDLEWAIVKEREERKKDV